MARVYPQASEYDSEDLMQYLETLERPLNLMDDTFQKLGKKAYQYLVCNRYLYKRSEKYGIPPQQVISQSEECREVIKALHNKLGHCSWQATYEQISRRYHWLGMYID